MVKDRQISQPRYREAYPRINLIEAEAAISNGRTVCQFENERGWALGQAILTEIGDDSVLLVHAKAMQKRTGWVPTCDLLISLYGRGQTWVVAMSAFHPFLPLA